jgi:predicted DNA binding CopG/RHH family protein
MAKRKCIPGFQDEATERAFWAAHDSDDHVDWSKAHRAVLPALRPALKTISLRLPAALLNDLRTLANKRDVPYQSLLKILLAERLEQELALPERLQKKRAS